MAQLLGGLEPDSSALGPATMGWEPEFDARAYLEELPEEREALASIAVDLLKSPDPGVRHSALRSLARADWAQARAMVLDARAEHTSSLSATLARFPSRHALGEALAETGLIGEPPPETLAISTYEMLVDAGALFTLEKKAAGELDHGTLLRFAAERAGLVDARFEDTQGHGEAYGPLVGYHHGQRFIGPAQSDGSSWLDPAPSLALLDVMAEQAGMPQRFYRTPALDREEHVGVLVAPHWAVDRAVEAGFLERPVC